MSQPPQGTPRGPPILPSVKLNQHESNGNFYNLPPINGVMRQGAPSQAPPYNLPGQNLPPIRRLNIEDALTYLDQVKSHYQNNSEIYNQFLDIMKDFNTQRIDTPGVIDRVSGLFGSNPTLIQGFNTFLPPDYSILYLMDPNDPAPIKISTPSGTVSKGVATNFTSYAPLAEPSVEPVEMDDAINYVNKIKIRFTKQPEIYNSFIEILQTFQKEQQPIQEVYAQISVLFKDAPDLLGDFQKFLPDIGGTSAPPDLALPPVGNFGVKPDSPYPDELRFFEGVKAHINNQETYSNFVKLLNLFTNGVIDKATLLKKSYLFIGSNADLFDWFRSFLKYDTEINSDNQRVITNQTKESAHFEYDLLPAAGPSYRQLPKLETLDKCSGRDEMCWSVLNDEWVGHPTWASEDSGFVAHKKNQYEEVLFRIEEERHEYDYYLEANLRTIQTLETVAKQILAMTPEQKKTFSLKDGVGATSQTIYKKVIRKVYGDENGLKIIEAIQNTPTVAIPVVLKRLKLKDEEWRRAQREWNRVWREQEQKVAYKSLDHMGLNFKTTDKKQLNVKYVLSEMKSAKLEQMHMKISRPDHGSLLQMMPQATHALEDLDVLADIAVLLVQHTNASGMDLAAKKDVVGFYAALCTLVFGMDRSASQKLEHSSIFPEEIDAGVLAQGGSETSSEASEEERSEKRKKGKEKENKLSPEEEERLRKEAMVKNVVLGLRRAREKESRLFVAMSEELERGKKRKFESKEQPLADIAVATRWQAIWINASTRIGLDEELPEVPRNLYATKNMYFLVCLIYALYERLCEVKKMTGEIAFQKDLEKHRSVTSFAKRLELNLHYDTFVLPSASSTADLEVGQCAKNIYDETLDLIGRLFAGTVDSNVFEETLRQTFQNKAYKLFSVQKVVSGIVTNIRKVLSLEGPEFSLFKAFEEGTAKALRSAFEAQQNARRAIGESEEMYRIEVGLKKLEVFYVGTDDLWKDSAQLSAWETYLANYLGIGGLNKGEVELDPWVELKDGGLQGFEEEKVEGGVKVRLAR